MKYNWQYEDWPQFRYDTGLVESDVVLFAERTGRLDGLVQGLSDSARQETIADLLITEALQTSSIEGDYLSRQDVRSSVYRQLGLALDIASVKDQRAEGIAELLIHLRETYAKLLSKTGIFSWHRMLMKGSRNVVVGKWRQGGDPMQIISGRIDQPTVHFEAPPSGRVSEEMKGYIEWFNRGNRKDLKTAPIRAALAHLYFESIHPFEDGNGRIGRALADKALGQGTGGAVLYSLSHAIEADKKSYYDALEKAQRGLEVSDWIAYFVKLILRAQQSAEGIIEFVLKKAVFLDRFRGRLEPRQERVILRMLEAGPEGFEGGMNARKYGSLTKVSKSTATRDLQALAKIGALVPEGGGRSVRYCLAI